jgi:hypothetical protein
MTTATYLRPEGGGVDVATLCRADGITALPCWHILMRPSTALTVAYAVAAIVSLLLALRASRAVDRRVARHSQAVAVAAALVALYLAYWRILGLRTWL